MNLQIINDACILVAQRLGMKPNVAKLCIDKVLFFDNKNEVKLNENEFIRASLIFIYWAAPNVGGKLKPLSVTIKDFIKLIEGKELSVDNEEELIEVVRFYEHSLANSFDISSLDSISYKLTHFSAKLTHSKAIGSVFIPTNRISNLPYLFSATLQKTAPLPVDLSKNDGDANAQSVARLINGDTVNFVNANVADKTLKWHHSRDGHQVNTNSLDARLRQVIIPDESGKGYIALSPMYAGGISRRIGEVNSKSKLNGDRIKIPFGGANPQNISVHGQHLSNVWLFNTPTINFDIKVAFSIALNGYFLKIDKGMAKAYSNWLQLNPKYGSDRDTLTAEKIEINQSPFSFMINDVLDGVESAMISCQIAKNPLNEKFAELKKDVLDLSALERSILSGAMTELAVNDLSSRIIRAMIKLNVFSTDSTNERHLHVIPEIIKSRFTIILGVN